MGSFKYTFYTKKFFKHGGGDRMRMTKSKLKFSIIRNV